MHPSDASLRAIIALQNRIVSAGVRVEAVMAAVVAEVPRLLPQCNGAVVEMRDGDDMVYRAATGVAGRTIGLRLPLATSLSGLCVRSGEAQYAADTEFDERVDREACRKIGIRSMICYPLVKGESTVGALKAFSLYPNAFHESDVDLLGMVSGVIASSIQHAVDYESVLHASKVDPLTALGNRAAFEADIGRLIARAKRSSDNLTVALLDLNGFKQINDVYGHAAGDTALAGFGYALSRGLRSGDQAYRLGGDEFVVIFIGASMANGQALLERIRNAVSETGVMDQPLTFSAGLSELSALDERSRADQTRRRAHVRRKTCRALAP